MKLRILLGVVAVLCVGVVLAGAYWLHQRRNRVDEFGHPISIHPGSAKVNPGAQATVEDARERAALPEYQDVAAAAAAELTPALELDEKHTEWTRSQGDAASSRYSALTQINKENVQNLQVAWTYHSKDGAANIQCTPVIVGGVLYAPTAGNYVVALDAQSGSELWRFKPGGHPAQRGLTYWPGDKTLGPRLFFTSGPFLFALDPKTGKAAAGFGVNGRVPSGGMVSPVIYEDVLVAANFNVVNGYEIGTGRLLWKYDVLPGAAKGGDDGDRGANIWGGMAMDVGRGIVYVVTGSPHPNFIGVDHPGQNKGANSVIALNARSGREIWSFQEIRHDIWDLDTPAPPNLVTVTHDGKRVDAVAEVTKLGNTLLLDRLTGKPLFPYRLRRAPVSKLPGERTWPYQPVFALPQPFARQEFQESDITDISAQAHAFVAEQVKKANYGWFQPFEPGKPTVYYNVHGGAQWTGAAFDPDKGWLYLNANEIPWMMTVLRTRVGAEISAAHEASAGEMVYRQNCAGCHGENRKGKGMAPSLVGLANRMLDDEAIAIMTHGRNAMPAIPVPVHKRQKLIDFLFDRDIPVDDTPTTSKTQYTYFPNGYPKLVDDRGYPGSKPPWGTLNAIDLNTGKLVWKVPLGEYDELTKQGIPKTGTENFGGATVTAGGVVFCAGTRDLKIRAFDKENGRELWSAKLPFGGFAPPATYAVNGRQYVVIASTGGGKLGGPVGDTYVAFALPRR